MFGRKTRKEIQKLRKENQELRNENAQFKSQHDKKDTAVVIDTNILLYWVGVCGEKKFFEDLRGMPFIPWVVHKELQVMYYGAKRVESIQKNGDTKEMRGLQEFLSQFTAEERMHREKTGQEALSVYPFVQEKIEQGQWKLIGKDIDIEPYLKGFNGEVEKELKIADAKILATCLMLADKFEFQEVILLTGDRRLREKAIEYGIRAEARLTNLIKK